MKHFDGIDNINESGGDMKKGANNSTMERERDHHKDVDKSYSKATTISAPATAVGQPMQVVAELKLESTRKKLHKSYQDIEIAKNKRKIQVIEYLPTSTGRASSNGKGAGKSSNAHRRMQQLKQCSRKEMVKTSAHVVSRSKDPPSVPRTQYSNPVLPPRPVLIASSSQPLVKKNGSADLVKALDKPVPMMDLETRFESAKRKFQESCEKDANKRRRIQVIDYQPIPAMGTTTGKGSKTHDAGGKKLVEQMRQYPRMEIMKTLMIHAVSSEKPAPKTQYSNPIPRTDVVEKNERGCPSYAPISKPMPSMDESKLQSVRKKFQDSYEKNATNKRTIQVIDHQPIPMAAASQSTSKK